MSVQFGKWNFTGEPLAPQDLSNIEPLLRGYGPDGMNLYSHLGVSILYCAFHSTSESRVETQPQATKSSAVVTWDGRLDNRAELIALLREELSIEPTDAAIVGAAFERWGTACFRKLVGDWALAIWNPSDRSLLLAKDPVGTCPLYYSVDEREATWSTILDPLVLFAQKTPALDEEYIAGCFSFFPAVHLTPYASIHSVPPSFFRRASGTNPHEAGGIGISIQPREFVMRATKNTNSTFERCLPKPSGAGSARSARCLPN